MEDTPMDELQKLRKNFAEACDAREKSIVKDARLQSIWDALKNSIEENVGFVRREVVSTSTSCETNALKVMYCFQCVGAHGNGDLFFEPRTREFYRHICLSEHGSPQSIHVVQKNSFYSLGEYTVDYILQKIARNKQEGNKGLFYIPNGYHVFEFSAQWVLGGYDTPPERKEVIVRAGSLDEAMISLGHHLRACRETHFWNFTVRTKDRSQHLEVLCKHDGSALSLLPPSS